MPIKLKVLVTILSSQLAIAMLVLQLGEGALGWGAVAVVVLLSLGIIHLIIRSSLISPLAQLCATIQTVKMGGDLALRADVNGVTNSTAITFNDLLDNFRSIIGKVIFNSNQVAT